MLLDATLRDRIQRNLRAFPVRRAAAGTHRAAAVAVVLADEGDGAHLDRVRVPLSWSGEAALILTRRALHLRNHPGQWALPGGRIEPGESPEQAALRELQEEVGLRLAPEAVLGRLDDYATRSGFVITPVLLWAGPTPPLVPNDAEVASIHRIPLEEFMRPDAPWLEPMPGEPHPALRMPVGSGWIAAPTAAVLYQFREVCLAGRSTRVAHFGEPLFARR